jgi:tRNA(Ile)-lysidine synthase
MRALHPGEVLLTAHHQDDQLETVLLQLLRGAGVAGLAAMPEVTPFAAGRLARPLLSRSRAELESWARARKLAWVEDDSNVNERFDRNYLRGTVLPLIRTRWPGAATAVSRTARHAGEAQRLLDTLARADVESAAIGNQLSVQRLRAFDIERRRNALRYWISAQGHRVPDSSRLDEIAGPLLSARADARPAVCWGDSVVKREADALWLGSERVRQTPSEEVTWDWQEAHRLELPAFGGVLQLVSDPYGPLDLETLPSMLTIRARRGGERLRPGRTARTRTLKSLLQEARVPHDERATLPLIYNNDQLLAVADRWVDASVQASDTSMRRARFVWRTS